MNISETIEKLKEYNAIKQNIMRLRARYADLMIMLNVDVEEICKHQQDSQVVNSIELCRTRQEMYRQEAMLINRRLDELQGKVDDIVARLDLPFKNSVEDINAEERFGSYNPTKETSTLSGLRSPEYFMDDMHYSQAMKGKVLKSSWLDDETRKMLGLDIKEKEETPFKTVSENSK